MRFQRGKNARKKSGNLFVLGVVIGLCVAMSLTQGSRRVTATLEGSPIVFGHVEASGHSGPGTADPDFVTTAMVTGKSSQGLRDGAATGDSPGTFKIVLPAAEGRHVNEPDLARIEAGEPGRRVLIVTASAPDLASVVPGVGDKMRELERKMTIAGEKLQDAADRFGSKFRKKPGSPDDRGDEGEKSVAGFPAVPAESIDSAEIRAHEKFQIRSRLCATREKAIAETTAGLESVVASRLKKLGWNDSRFVRKAIEQLKPKFEVDESFREVAGDRYPLYVASVSVDLGPNFERQSLRLANQQTARQRFAGLMGLSFGVLALLVGFDQLVPGRSREPVNAASNIA